MKRLLLAITFLLITVTACFSAQPALQKAMDNNPYVLVRPGDANLEEAVRGVNMASIGYGAEWRVIKAMEEGAPISRIKELAAQCREIDYINANDGYNLLEAALRSGRIDAIEFILTTSAKKHVNVVWKVTKPQHMGTGLPPLPYLAYAVIGDRADIARLLVDAGADPNWIAPGGKQYKDITKNPEMLAILGANK